MKVVALIGGLGSQMFKYAFYLALRENTTQRCLIDTTFFSQRESWNGYELDRVFGIEAPDIKDELSSESKKELNDKSKSYIDICINHLMDGGPTEYYFLGTKLLYKTKQDRNAVVRKIRQKALFLCNYFGIKHEYSLQDVLSDNNAYFDEYPHNSDSHFHEYKDIVRKAFSFKEFDDERNSEISVKMSTEASVAIHIRRTDHMVDNIKLFKNGFFKKSVQFIRDKTEEKLVFYVFSDDLDWCKTSITEIGLKETDEIIFVDWNNGKDSYRDMQLMTYCKHNIVPISSFSWWGYYLSDREDKIVCAPNGYWLEIPNHF